MVKNIAVVLKGYPRLSETFIAQEILELQKAGLPLQIISLRHPTDQRQHPVHREITAPVSYLPEYLHQEPARVMGAWLKVRRLPGYARALAAFKRDFARDRTRNRARRFGQACVLAAELPPQINWLYAHFLHTPASVTRYAALMTGLPWSVSAHARDIWTSPDWEKVEKLAEMDWLVTCTAVGHQHLAELAPDPEKVGLVYHGLDLDRFPSPPEHSSRNGSDSTDPVRLLSVGRAVEKKGYPDLLNALAALPEGLAWQLTHIGGGEKLNSLKAQAVDLGLDSRITWKGAQPQEEVIKAYQESDVFLLASRIAGDGDRDGLPNVLMEAQSQALACLSTEVSAIPELIETEKSGLLVPPNDPAALAEALKRMITEPDLRKRLGQAGREKVTSAFGLRQNIGALLDRFGGDKALGKNSAEG
ncbi:glycosyltransferase family 4 protein [Rhodovibrionaceae bacterium A322]